MWACQVLDTIKRLKLFARNSRKSMDEASAGEDGWLWSIGWALLLIYYYSGCSHNLLRQLLTLLTDSSSSSYYLQRDDYQYEDPWYIMTLFLFDVVMVLSLSTAVTLGTLTFVGIRKGITVSANKRSIELKLLVAVTAQVNFIGIVPQTYFPFFSRLWSRSFACTFPTSAVSTSLHSEFPSV